MPRSEHEKQWRREHRQKANVEGRCTQCCVLPREPDRAYCVRCLEGQRVRKLLKQRDARRSHKCTQCFKACEGRAKTCGECRAQQRTRYFSKLVEGVCVGCKNTAAVTGKVMCARCSVRTSQNGARIREKRLLDKQCVKCGSTCVEGQRRCETCLFKAFASGIGWSQSRWLELKDLFDKQEGRCALTGVRIHIRETRRSNQLDTASIDHITPASKGGANTLDNLQWTSWLANRAKTNLDNEEFLGLCTMVVLNGMRKDGVTSTYMDDVSAYARQEIEDFDRAMRT